MSSLLSLMELKGPAKGSPDISLIIVIIPLPKLAPGLCSKALDFIKSIPRSATQPGKIGVILSQSRIDKTDSQPMHISPLCKNDEDGIKKLAHFLSAASQQPSRGLFLPRKTAKFRLPVSYANSLHVNRNLQRLAIFCEGDIQFDKEDMMVVKDQMLSMFMDKVPITIWYGSELDDASTVIALSTLAQSGARVLSHITSKSCKIANPFKISASVPSSFKLKQDLDLTLTISQGDLAWYSKGGDYFHPASCPVPHLSSMSDSATWKVTLLYNRENEWQADDSHAPSFIPERFHISMICDDGKHQHNVDCVTAGFQMSLNPLISNFRGLTPLIFGFSGAGKSSFVNSVNFIATSSTNIVAATGNYDGQVTLCLNTIPIGTNGDITVIDSVGMTTGENEVSFLDIIGADFGAAMLNQSAVLQYQHMNPEKIFTFPENRVNCVLGVVSLSLLQSSAVKKKMTKVAHKLTSEFGVMTVWAVTHVESASDNARFKAIAESIDFATLIPVANYTHFDSHNFSKEIGIMRVLLALENAKFAPKLPTPVMVSNAMQYAGSSTSSAFESDSMSYISRQEISYTATPRQMDAYSVAVPDIGKGSTFDQYARGAAPKYNVFSDGASSSSASTVETYVPASPATSSHWAPPAPPQGSLPQHGGPPVNGAGLSNAASADAEYTSRLERKIRTFEDSGSERPPGYR
ncbi:hypothetical protein HDU77_008378 [Chytriomyces hyalinus]|nr:hypothetical protein HDU77_008378 [Chytriomyces hyalinus]